MPYKRCKKWEGQIKLPNGKKRRKGGFETHKAALGWEVEQRKMPVEELATTGMACLYDWADAYLNYASAKHVRKTYEEKKSALAKFLAHLNPHLPVTDVTPGIALQYLQVQKEKRSGNAANKDRKNLMAAWNWGMKFMTPTLPGPNPFLAVEKFSEKRHPRYVPSEDDFWTVVDSLPIGQDRDMLLTYIFTAARRDEIFRLRREDVNLVSNELTLWYRKNRNGQWKDRRLPMVPELVEVMTRRMRAESNDLIFFDPETGEQYKFRQRWLKKICDRAGVKPFGFHGIRHLTASVLAKKNVPLPEIQIILGHENLTTTEKYIKSLGDVRYSLDVLRREKDFENPGPHSDPQPVIRQKKHLKLIVVNG